MKLSNKYKVGDLVFDEYSDAFGIITKVKYAGISQRRDNGDKWGYYIRWQEGITNETYEFEYQIKKHPDKDVLTVGVIPF